MNRKINLLASEGVTFDSGGKVDESCVCITIPKPKDNDEHEFGEETKHAVSADDTEARSTSPPKKRSKTVNERKVTEKDEDQSDGPTENDFRDVVRSMVATRGPSKTC